MSDPTPGSAPAAAASETTTQEVETVLENVAADVSKALPAVETVLSVLIPGSGAAITTAMAIAKGVAAGIPSAIALLDEFQSGTVPTQAELDAYMAQELTAYDQLMADIAAKQNATA